MDAKTKKELTVTATKVRIGIIEAVAAAKSGHPGGSLSMSDVLTYLYFKELRNLDPTDPKAENRDRFVLSKGHCAPALYSVLANRGFFPVETLKTLRKPGSFLQGHPDMKGTPGVDMSSGSLGQGVSVACGMARSAKLQNRDYRVYAYLGDGECEEGEVWEAAMFAGHYKLDNLVAIVDYNGLQIDGRLSEVCSPEPIAPKFEAFNWNVICIDGHNLDEIEAAFEAAKRCKGKPTAIIAKCIKGKGVSFMEDKASWHGSAPNVEQTEQALAELNATLAEAEAM